MADATGYEVAKAWITIVPTLNGAQETISKELGVATESASKEVGEKSGKTFGSSIAKGLKASAAVIAGAMTAATAGAVAASKAFVDTAKQTANMGDTIDKESQKVGFSVKSWQEMDYVLKICGSEMSSMSTGIKTLTNKLDDAKNGSESAQKMFAALGLSMDDIKNMSVEEVFKASVQGFQNMSDSAERAALANDLFGRSGQSLQPLFNLSNSEMESLISKANEYGMIMSDDGVKASAAFKDSLTTLDGTMTGLKNNIMTRFMPGLTQATEGLADVFAGKGSTKLVSGLKTILKQLKDLSPAIFKTIQEVGLSALEGLAPMLPELVSTIFTLLISAITILTGMIPEMMPSIILGIKGIFSAVLGAMPVIIQGMTTLLLALADWLSNGGAEEMIDGIMMMISTILDNLSIILPPLLKALVTVISEIAKALTKPSNVEMLIQSILTVIGAIAVAIWDALPVVWDLIKGVIGNIGELLGDFLFWAVPKVANALSSVIETVKGWGKNIKDFFTGLWQNLKDGIHKNLENLKTKFTSVFDNVKTTVKNAIEKIKSFFKFTWSLPKIKMPHFSIKGSFSLNPLSVPTIGVSWYAKAMDNPFILNNPTIFGAMNGNLLGGGERGSELVVGVEKLMEMIANAKGGDTVINVYGAEGQNVNDLAEQIAYKLEELKNRKAAIYA